MNIFSAAAKKMDWLASRQKVIAGNIANLNTPHYLPRDLQPLSFRRELNRAAGSDRPTLTITSPGHIASSAPYMTTTNAKHLQAPGTDGRRQAHRVRRPFETTIDGNGVVLEEQMAKEKDIKSDHAVALAAYDKHFQMLKKSVSASQ
jgi:flagellar basal-body rod protein FlgB